MFGFFEGDLVTATASDGSEDGFRLLGEGEGGGGLARMRSWAMMKEKSDVRSSRMEGRFCEQIVS